MMMLLQRINNHYIWLQSALHVHVHVHVTIAFLMTCKNKACNKNMYLCTVCALVWGCFYKTVKYDFFKIHGSLQVE